MITAPYCGLRFDDALTVELALGVAPVSSAVSDAAACGIGLLLNNGVRSPTSLGGSEFARVTRYSIILPSQWPREKRVRK